MPLSSPDADSTWLATLTVLYVEDDALAARELAAFLGRRVKRLVSAPDGAEGLLRFREERPSLVLTDIHMPGMDGLTMLAEIRKLDANVPVVVTTAFEQIDYLERSIEVGVDRYVTKPVDLDKLEAALLYCANRLRGIAAIAHERELELAKAKAHEREAVGLLAGGMAHDFNNMLQVVVGNLGLARDMITPGCEQCEILDDAMSAALQAADLGAKLVTLAERSSGPFARQTIVPLVRESVASTLEGTLVDIDMHIDPDLPNIWCGGDLLRQAFTNVVQNASDAMVNHGRLRVDVALCDVAEHEVRELIPGRYIKLTFRDSGPGIARDLLPRVFDAYFSTKPNSNVRGRGLGLALCLAIVRQHHGMISAASPVGSGAIISMWLPTFDHARAAHA